MSGHCSGVQQRIRAVAPQAIYVHCYTHCLNLVLVIATKKVSDSADFFAIIESLYVFLLSAKAHVIYCQQQMTMHPDKPVLYVSFRVHQIIDGHVDTQQLML